MPSLRFVLFAASALVALPAVASPLTVSGSVGGAPTAGVVRDNLDWIGATLPLPLFGAQNGSSATGSPQSGIIVRLFGGTSPTADDRAGAVTGSVAGKYAAPFLSGGNGTGFGNANGPLNPPAGNQPNGPDASVYLTSGSTGASPGTRVEILLPGPDLYFYFGLLWGSVDAYNTLSFFDGTTLIGSITGSDVVAAPNGDQGVNGTLYVNITSTLGFNRVVASSSAFAFEFDNLAFSTRNPFEVPEPASLALLGAGLLGLGFAARRRRS